MGGTSTDNALYLAAQVTDVTMTSTSLSVGAGMMTVAALVLVFLFHASRQISAQESIIHVDAAVAAQNWPMHLELASHPHSKEQTVHDAPASGEVGHLEGYQGTDSKPEDDLNVADALLAFEKAVSRIRSYDVYLHVTHRWLMKSKIIGTVETPLGNRPITKPSPRGPNEMPLVHTADYRQVRSQDGKLRIEWMGGDFPGQTEGVTINNVGLTQSYWPSKMKASISPIDNRLLMKGHNYEDFRTAISHALLEVLRNRRSTFAKGKGPSIMIEAPPEGNSRTGYRVWLDSEHALLPRKIERYRIVDGREVVCSRTTFERFHQLESRDWAPVKFTTTFLVWTPLSDSQFGKTSSIIEAVVDIEQSTWNERVKEDLFVLTYPPSTRVEAARQDTSRH